LDGPDLASSQIATVAVFCDHIVGPSWAVVRWREPDLTDHRVIYPTGVADRDDARCITVREEFGGLGYNVEVRSLLTIGIDEYRSNRRDMSSGIPILGGGGVVRASGPSPMSSFLLLGLYKVTQCFCTTS
jgi:hypothetical protein